MKDTKAAPLELDSDIHDVAQGPVYAIERFLARQILSFAGNAPISLVLWNGEEVGVGDARSIARIHVRDRAALWKLCLNPDLHFGDLYSFGRVDIEGDFIRFLESVYRGGGTPSTVADALRGVQRFLNRPRRNTLARSRDHISHHYDLGNDFYERWLDNEAMQYTCAYYPEPELTLEQAQRAKMDLVCRKLRLRPGDRVVEAGCGWGGLARHMAGHYGVTVHSYNISHEQIRYARDKARQQGLEGRVEYVEDDYRNIRGEYDVFVSVGMLEHVGRDNYRVLGRVIDGCLTEHGRGLVHSIGRNRPEPMNAWIEKRIFPGAYPPSLREMMEIFEPYCLSVLDVENLRLHYAQTLSHWLERFERDVFDIEKTYDKAFVRAWRLYLAGSIATFTTGYLQLFQVVFARERDNELPSSRAHLYR
jgi:cyclopropane-fatty-acyl-phospholipid synthase